MNEPELFLVTLISGDGSLEVDMELPSQLQIGELRGRILDILKTLYEDQFDGWQSCQFEYNNRVLRDDETLLKIGAFDGSKLYVIEE
ncbi:MAG: hypothetical protein IJP53_01750 [Synergistaceae bacterium]|nr:hypothetical protein [Synergistaceae bacterium]